MHNETLHEETQQEVIAMAKKKKSAKAKSATKKEAPATPEPLYVAVHRNSNDEVVEVGDPFVSEGDGGYFASKLAQSVNLFVGDYVRVEVEVGQIDEAINH
jgi:hypothetical protein